MAIKKDWNEPTTDENYELGVMTIAPMNEIPKVKTEEWTEYTGKNQKGLEHIVSSEDLKLGIVIAAADGRPEEEEEKSE